MSLWISRTALQEAAGIEAMGQSIFIRGPSSEVSVLEQNENS